jgi:hypothetical protein
MICTFCSHQTSGGEWFSIRKSQPFKKRKKLGIDVEAPYRIGFAQRVDPLQQKVSYLSHSLELR